LARQRNTRDINILDMFYSDVPQAAIGAIFERGTKRGLKVLKSLGGAGKIAATLKRPAV
jgi:hypothetical protein